MSKWTLILSGAALTVALLANPARADRVPSRKVETPREHGARPDIFIPYHTNGTGTLGVYQGVSPIIYNNPGLGNPAQKGDLDAQLKPVHNLIYYGSKLNSGGTFNGPMQREPNKLRPNR